MQKRFKKRDFIRKIRKSGVRPPYQIYVDAPYENPYGIMRIGMTIIRGKTVREVWRKYKRLWRKGSYEWM